MKFKNRKEQRQVLETLDTFLSPMMPYLKSEVSDKIKKAMEILRETEVEHDDV